MVEFPVNLFCVTDALTITFTEQYYNLFPIFGADFDENFCSAIPYLAVNHILIFLVFIWDDLNVIISGYRDVFLSMIKRVVVIKCFYFCTLWVGHTALVTLSVTTLQIPYHPVDITVANLKIGHHYPHGHFIHWGSKCPPFCRRHFQINVLE